ncbi:serine/threonine protein kinase [Polyangium jinanense]|uniref:Protein kinase n=1 Tax=Polyangium jinanense TaxID=2829994 RepID=A0A9X3X737_9BACT|nr:serine/threonine protein kinase [Polyangium jinanense]MDC3957505.1 protein kinase [Polyangium jinanense]MDC3985004.1 protein kinase [Polyangium jinanense]
MIGKVVAGRYRLETRIGEGGMGVVYRARHVLIDRVVALKLIRPDLRGETHLRAWMLREARAANRVDHAHIIDIHDIGETEEGELYLVMEYLVGTPLSAELARGPMPIARGVDILEQMCAALARAHDLGVVHRDLKSDNILLTQRGGRKDFVKILDFGLAAIARDPRLAPKGAVFGTPEYMSPEQARGEEATPHADLYALGVLFYEMLTGQLPFRANDRETLLEMQRTAIPRRPRTVRPDAHPQGEMIAMRLLEKDIRKRYRDAHHLQEELKALQRSLPSTPWEMETGEAVPAPPPPPPPQSAGVTEWANRTALFARMVARAHPAGNAPPDIQAALAQLWDLAAKANRLEGEVASHTRKVEALERRGRALRAEIGRKVEELAHEESRVMREAAADGEDVDKVRSELAQAEKLAMEAKQLADGAARQGAFDRTVFERAGATAATVQAKREQLARYEAKKNTRETTARDLRRQIDELRGQLTRYAEALEEDLGQGREKVTQRTREGLAFEKAFSDASNLLLAHLRNKPECRDLVAELLTANKDANTASTESGEPKPSLEKRPGN